MPPSRSISEGVWENGPYELQPPRAPSAVFVLPENEESPRSNIAVYFLHRSIFADLPESELDHAVRNAVLPRGTATRVRTWREDSPRRSWREDSPRRSWREDGVRRWRMQAVQDDCYYDAVAFDVRERGDFFEVWETHLGTRCRELEGRADERCRNADAAFGAVPRGAASVEGLEDAYSGDASLSP